MKTATGFPMAVFLYAIFCSISQPKHFFNGMPGGRLDLRRDQDLLGGIPGDLS